MTQHVTRTQRLSTVLDFMFKATEQTIKISTASELEKAVTSSKTVVYKDNSEVTFTLRKPEGKRKSAYYRFTIPKRVAGKRITKQASTPSKLLLKLEEELDGLNTGGMTIKEKAEFQLSLEDLRDLRVEGIKLAELISHYRGTKIPKANRKRLSEVQAELMSLKLLRNPAKDTVRSNNRHGRRIVSDFRNCFIDEIELDGAYNWVMSATCLSGKKKGLLWDGKTRQHNWNWLNELLEYAVSEGYAKSNPLSQLYREKLAALQAKDSKEPEILTVAQAEEYLNVVREKKPELLPLVALNLFAGIRLHESMRLQWKDIQAKNKEIHVSERIAKGRHTRFVKLNDAARSWIAVCIKHRLKNANKHPQLSSYSEESIAGRLYHLRKYHLSFEWPQNAPRHSYASHSLVLYGEDYTKKQMGHSYNSDMLFKHYRAAVSDSTAKAYFNIMPKDKKG